MSIYIYFSSVPTTVLSPSSSNDMSVVNDVEINSSNAQFLIGRLSIWFRQIPLRRNLNDILGLGYNRSVVDVHRSALVTT